MRRTQINGAYAPEDEVSESGAVGQRSKLRLENLSDLVFGLALSLGSIVLVSKSVATPSDLVTNVALFGFSFIIVIWIWSGYTRVMAVLPTEVRGTFMLNIALLFCVAIEPYLFYVLYQPISLSFLDFASSLYALDGAAMMFILAGLGYIVMAEENRSKASMPGFNPERFRQIVYAEVVSGAIFLVSALPFTWIHDGLGSFLRFDSWYLVFIAFLVVLGMRRRAGISKAGHPA